MLELGTKAPTFALPDLLTGRIVALDAYEDCPALLVMFVCRHCPYVKHVQHELVRLAADYQPRHVGIVAISSNDAEAYPDDRPESLKEWAQQLGFTFPLCYDESQSVAKAYSARCTPEFFLLDRTRHLVYRGQLDDSRPNSGRPVTGRDLRAALDRLLEGKPIDQDQRPSVGCSIKWRKGNAPT
jgi:peroxiredoxin